jgi:hypothetical protein
MGDLNAIKQTALHWRTRTGEPERPCGQVDSRIPRSTIGLHVFNASSLLANVLVTNGSSTLLAMLVHDSDYPVRT